MKNKILMFVISVFLLNKSTYLLNLERAYALHPLNLFTLIHEVYSFPTIDGCRYFLTIVDDHSRATWIYLLKNKSDVLHVFPGFIAMVENQFKMKVQSVRSDNAHELKFADLFLEKGIIAYHSCHETPQQNSVVERKHQHILNVARALLFQSNVPLEFWGDCVMTAVFLIKIGFLLQS